MDSSAISATYLGVKTAVETLKSVMGAKFQIDTDAKISGAFEQLGKVQDTLFALRDALANLQDENHRLQERLRDQEGWPTRSAKYELAQSSATGMAMKSKTEPHHWACPACFEGRKIQVLQVLTIAHGSYRCPGCNHVYFLNPVRPSPPSRRIPFAD